MSYSTDLQSNNTDLQAILDAINALPEAKEIETVTGTVEWGGRGDLAELSLRYHFTAPDFSKGFGVLENTDKVTITAVKNTMFHSDESVTSFSGGCEEAEGGNDATLWLTGDGFSIVIK